MRFLPFAVAIGLAACARGGQHGTTVSGDVYFAAVDGEGKHASDAVAYLLKSPDSLESRQATICDSYQRTAVRLKTQLLDAMAPVAQAGQTRDAVRKLASTQPRVDAINDSILDLSQETIRRVNDLIASLKIDTATTGIDARFRFARVRSGRYVLLARGVFGGNALLWRRSVEVSGDSTRADLGTKESEPFLEFSCGVSETDLQPVQHTDPARLRDAVARVNALDKADAAAEKEGRRRLNGEDVYEADSAARTAAYDLDKVDVRPVLQTGNAASELHDLGLQPGAIIKARFIIEPTGVVSHVVADHIDAAGAVIVVLSNRRYSPAKKGGEPVAVRMTETFVAK